jgi:hypothetical protein
MRGEWESADGLTRESLSLFWALGATLPKRSTTSHTRPPDKASRNARSG